MAHAPTPSAPPPALASRVSILDLVYVAVLAVLLWWGAAAIESVSGVGPPAPAAPAAGSPGH